MESNLINWISNCNSELIDVLVTISKNDIFICRKSLKKIIKTPKKLFKMNISYERYDLLKKELENIDIYYNNKNNEIILISNYNINDFNSINSSIDSGIKLIIYNNFNINQRYVKVITENCNNSNDINNNNKNDNIINNGAMDINYNKNNLINSPVPYAFGNNNLINIELIPKTSLYYFDKRIPFEIVHLLSTNEYSKLINSINSIYVGMWIMIIIISLFLMGIIIFSSMVYIKHLKSDSWIAIVVLSSISFSFILFRLYYKNYLRVCISNF